MGSEVARVRSRDTRRFLIEILRQVGRVIMDCLGEKHWSELSPLKTDDRLGWLLPV